MKTITASSTINSTAMIGFLERSQKKRVSTATSREGGGAVAINFVRWAGQTLRAVVLCHATLSRASVVKEISIISLDLFAARQVCTRQSFLRRYNLTYECILELF